MNIKLHFVRDLHGKVVEYEFVRSENNVSDILTKNATKMEHDRHAPRMVAEVPQVLFDTVWRDDGSEEESDGDGYEIEDVYSEGEEENIQPVAE